MWREDGILESFPTNGLTVRWRTTIGAGFSGPAVAGGRVFLMDRVTKEDPDTEVKIRWDFRDKTMGVERVLGVDEATGRILWTHSYLCKYSVAYGIGPRATPTVQGDKLYSLGTMGDLYCLEAATGKEVWKKNLWSIAHPTKIGMSITTPAIEENRLAVSSQYEGALMLQFKPGATEPEILWQASTGGSPEKEWKTKGFNTVFSTVLLRDRFMYGVSLYGEMCCLDGNTGERLWTTLAATSGGTQPKDRWCTAFLVPHRDRIFIFNEKGDLILTRLSAKGYEEISRAHLLEPDMPSDGSGGRKVARAHPAFANRCVYVRNNQELICVSLAAKP